MASIDAHDPSGPASNGSCEDSVSSASHSLAHDSGFSSNVAKPNSTASNSYHSLAGRQTRRSVNILGTLPTEISALIRSHSTSSRRHRPDQHDPDSQMGQDDERPTRKNKSQNRLYDFIARSLTRSRSRSQSRNGRVPKPDPDEPMPSLPTPSSPASKPESRIRSRPISSTTTATNTTITPANARTKKSTPPPNTEHGARSSTPNASSTSRKLRQLFGLASISRKSASRPNSMPRTSLDKNSPLPPLPSDVNQSSQSINSTPRPLRVFNADSRPQSPISGPLPLPLRNVSVSSAGSSNANNSSLLHKLVMGTKTPPTHSTEDVVPIERPSLHHRRNSSSNSTSTYHSAHSEVDQSLAMTAAADLSDPLAQLGLGPPRIIQTPPTPSGPDKSLPLTPASPTRLVDEFGGLEGDRVGVLRNESSNGHSRGSTPQRRYSHRSSTKHGSFDFERSNWGSGGLVSLQRSTSGGTASTESEHTAGPPITGFRDSAMGPGLAGVGTLQRDVSVRRAKEREDMVAKAKEEERLRRRGLEKRNGEPERHIGFKLDRNKSLQASHRTKSPETDRGHSPGEKTGSWGKRRGAPFSHSTTSKRLLSIGGTHGAFSFEPAVHSPTWSTNSTGSARDATVTASWKGGDKSKFAREQDAAKSKQDANRSQSLRATQDKGPGTDKKRASLRGDRAPVPVPKIYPGHRSGVKGHSLDLGLGLAWAAASIPGDSILSSAYFTRKNGEAGSQNGHSTPPVGPRQEKTAEADGGPIGSEVAVMFKNVLDEQSYARFIAYVNQWDAKQIGFDGQEGIVAKADELLAKSPHLTEGARKELLAKFIKLILRNM